MRICPLLLIVVLTATKLSAAEPITTLPYRIDYDGAIVVGATINGAGPYDFMIDTGATLTFVFENATNEQTFKPTGGAPIRVLGLVRTGLLPPYRLGDIALGGAVLPDHVGVIVPDWSNAQRTPQGVIGLDFLRQYDFYFDHAASMVLIYPPGGAPAKRTSALRQIKLHTNDFDIVSQHLYTSPGAISGEGLTFILDLGAPNTLINYKAFHQFYSSNFIFMDGAHRTNQGSLVDIFGDRKKVRAASVGPIRIGNVSWSRLDVLIYDAPSFDALHVQSQPYGLLGADLLIDRDFALDLANNQFFVAPRPGPRR